MILDSKAPAGPIAEKWTNYKFDRKLVNPANRRKYDVIVVGTGLAGGAAAATCCFLGHVLWSSCEWIVQFRRSDCGCWGHSGRVGNPRD